MRLLFLCSLLIIVVQGKGVIFRNRKVGWDSLWRRQEPQPWFQQGSPPNDTIWTPGGWPAAQPQRPDLPIQSSQTNHYPYFPQGPPRDNRTLSTESFLAAPVTPSSTSLSAISVQFPMPTTPIDTPTLAPTPKPGGADVSTLPKDPTYENFCAAIDAYSKTQWRDHPPRPSRLVYQWYQEIVGRVMSLPEQAMFLANIVWETAGLQYREELACRTGNCTYGQYFGRGYIQLTWDYNYRDASYDLFGDDRLLKHPEQVAEIEGGWRTALWYWRRHVTPRLVENDALRRFAFGFSVMAINGAVECTASSYRFDRLQIYNAILAAWGIDSSSPGRMTGCHVERKFANWDPRAQQPTPTAISETGTNLSTMKPN